MANERVRKIYEFLAVSGQGKKQSAFGAFQPQADIDVREKCQVTITENVARDPQYDCDGVDLIREAIRTRYVNISLDYQDGFTPQQAARWFAYLTGTAASATGTADTNEVQTLTRTGTVSGGTFTISLTHEGKTGTTEAIAYNATNSEILAALNKKTGTATAMGKLLKVGDVSVGGTWGTAISLTFAGRYAGANMTAVTVDTTNLTGSTPGITVATTTQGSNKFHALTRSTDGTLPPFSIIVGDKNDAYNDFMYGDCVVDSITISLEQAGGAVAKMQVNLFANYTPQRLTSYSAPACVNISPLKVEDCKVKINGTFETPDVASLTAAFNNNVPVDAAFGYDDIDITTAFQRGDIPTQNFTASIYGSPDTALYQLAEAEETDGNDTDFTLYLGQGGNRLQIAGADTKIKFQQNRLGYAGALQQSTINIEATPYNSPPLTYGAYLSQTASFLVAST